MSQIPKEVHTVLCKFRRWIRRYILLEGVALVVAVACLMFWATLLLDVVYFRVSNLELPTTFRLIVLMAMVGILVGLMMSWVLLRLLRRFRLNDLALVLERRFPQLRDQLITTVEMQHEPATPLKSRMLEQTGREAANKVAQLPLEETFDRTPLKRLLVTATVLLSTLAVLGVANASSMERWVNAYLLAKDDYWDPYRRHALSVKVVAQPGERLKEFDDDRVYQHPRGADLQLLVHSVSNVEAPETVSVQYRAFTGRSAERGRAWMNRFGEEQFRHTFSRVVDDHHLWIRGGDFVNRRPFRVQVVDPPQVDALSIEPDYPSYTGMDGLEDQLLEVVGTQISLPMETQFVLHAQCNKQLRGVQLRSNRLEVSFGFESSGATQRPTELILRDAESRIVKTVLINAPAEALFTRDETGFRLPLRITSQAEEQWAQLEVPAELPIPILPDMAFKLFLEDIDDIYSPEPSTLMINGIVDQAPVVDTRRTGIGSIVTRNARIPVEGKITDDYGVLGAWFGFHIDESEDEQIVPFSRSPTGQKEWVLDDQNGDRVDRPVERFHLRPLKLQEGQTLTLAVHAIDGDVHNGPHVAHGERFAFRVVSDDELMARLFERERNLRLRFEQNRAEMGELRKLLAEQAGELTQQADARTKADRDRLSSFVERSLHQLRKNHTESRSIEVSFRDLRAEMVNNGVDTKEKLERIDNGVIAPLSVLNEQLMPAADQRYALQRLALQRDGDISEAIQETLVAVDAVLAQMDRILEEMLDRGTMNDVIQNLQNLIEKQRELLEQTEEKRIQENFFFDFDQSP